VQAAGATEWQELGALPEFAACSLWHHHFFRGRSAAAAAPAGSAKTAALRSRRSSWEFWGSSRAGHGAAGIDHRYPGDNESEEEQRALKGDGLALAGTIISAIAFAVSPIMAAMLLPALRRRRNGRKPSIASTT